MRIGDSEEIILLLLSTSYGRARDERARKLDSCQFPEGQFGWIRFERRAIIRCQSARIVLWWRSTTDRMFSIKLILENLPRLTEEYNTRFLPLLKEHFEDFYDGLVDSGYDFGKKAVIPCEMRECDQDEYFKTLSHVPSFSRHDHLRKYKDVRDQMRKNQITFEPVTSDLIMLLERAGAASTTE